MDELPSPTPREMEILKVLWDLGPSSVRDVHATIMHLMGLNDVKLTFYSAGRNQRLTDTGGTVIRQVLA